MSGLPFKFPILTIPGLDPEKWWELVDCYADEDSFTLLDRHDRKSGGDVGRVVVDAAGRSWRLIRLKDLGMRKSTGFWNWLWAWVNGKHRVEYELSEERHIPFKDIKESICTVIRAKPDSWRDDEAIAGEAGPPRDEEEMLDELIQSVRKAKDVRELIAVLRDDVRI